MTRSDTEYTRNIKRKNKNISNEKIVKALLQYGTVREAAEHVGCQPKTIYNRMNNDDDFIESYNAGKSDVTRKAVANFNNKLSQTIDEVFSIMQDKNVNAAVRLQAAQTILNNAGKFAERLEKADAADEKNAEDLMPVIRKNRNQWENYSPIFDEMDIDYGL